MGYEFRFDRSCIPALARARQMQQAIAGPAEDVAAQARSLDGAGNYHAAPVVVTLANLSRAGFRVQDTTRDALRREFGTSRRAGLRTLGRLSGGRT